MTETLTPTDPRTSFAHAVATARAAVEGVQPHQLQLPTPCPDYDVCVLLGHMLTVFRRITALGNGADPMDMPEFVTGINHDAWPAVFLEAAHEVQAAWSDPAKLDQEMVLPWVTAPGAAMLVMYTSELTVHTWDLAVATGQQVQWHEPTVAVALEAASRALPPGDREAYFAEMAADPRFSPELGVKPPFRNPVEPGPDAPTIDRLVGWYGRQPLPSAA